MNSTVPNSVDVVIVGAGIIGSSVAMHLSQHTSFSIAVFDIDLNGRWSSSELNAGGVRATWINSENTAVSKLSLDYYRQIASEIGFREKGYLWMHPQSQWPKAQQQLSANALLRDLGIEFLTAIEVSQRFPFIENVGDVGGATFSPRDGLLNSNLLKEHYRNQARKKSVQFIDRVWVDHIESTDAAFPLVLSGLQFDADLDEENLRCFLTDASTEFLTGQRGATALRKKVQARYLVNCSGPWANRFSTLLGEPSYSFPVRRQISLFECKGLDLNEYGMFIDPSGVYFHAEAQNILAGFADPQEPHGFNLGYDEERFFEEKIWAPLYERSSKFEQLKHVTGWAGLYEVSPDHNAILGRAHKIKNVYEAHSFSGRGVMQSYAAGLAIAELLAKGGFETLNWSAFDQSRFKSGRQFQESLLI